MLDGGRIFHVNVNCSDLDRSRAFYTDGCGLVDGIRTTPDEVQSGTAFGIERARWDAWILVGAGGFDGGAIDLLQWLDPAPTGAPPASMDEPGFQRVGLEVTDLDAAFERCRARGGPAIPTADHAERPSRRSELVRDPDGTVIELVEGGAGRVAFVAVACADLDRSVAFYATLGFTEAGRTPAEVVLDAPAGGEVQLVLVDVGRPSGDRVRAARPANALGMWRTALLLPDLDGAVERLVEAGVELVSAPQAMAMGPGVPDLRFVCFRGPDGEVVELIEVPAAG